MALREWRPSPLARQQQLDRKNPDMTDAQIIIRLKNMATDAHLSGDDIKGKVLGEAAARLTELSIIHHTWHPSIEQVDRGL